MMFSILTKFNLCILIYCCFCISNSLTSYSQSLLFEKHLLSTAGGTTTSPNYFVEWSIGEVVFDKSNYLFPQGYIQSINKSIILENGNYNTIITPNDDGLNEKFIISDLGEEFSLLIYDRWSVLQYSNITYRNEFDGKDNSGKNLPDGVYVFICTSKSKSIQKKGTITIKRN